MGTLPQSKLEEKTTAETHVVDLVNEKLDEGFELISDEDCDELLHIDINEDDRLSDFEEVKVNPEETKTQEKSKEEEIVNETDVFENYVQKELKLSSFMKAQVDRIEEQAERFYLTSEIVSDKILVRGQKEDIFEFLNWLYALTVDITEDELSKFKHGKVVEKHGDYQQIEVAFSTFHRLHQNEIFSKANQLELICESAYDMLLLSGYLDSLKEFKAYLQEIEGSAKKALYPKYWDFYILPKFSEIDLQEGTLEFQEVKALFCASLKHMKITKLTRIQNKYLMENFITMLQKRQEYRDGIDTSRKLLFHGSRKINPRTIYEESDTGFDLQFSNPKGTYGKGLYFAVKSVYSHKFAHKLMNGSYQMLLADVFVGKSVIVGKGTNWVKAPPGYDSIESTNSSYIIYNNFHSYPLYLIEYIEDFDLILEGQNT